ncbi:hypothetical protein ACFVYR_11270 [Streptomyces sp. NPDC058284]|uniref:hypothetical protein n=1 Tax=unclassified Streptomyces TaxID=2593676 RepID=UPI00364A4EFF
MPAWITPRRLGAAAALYAVFVSGWWLGQPVRSDGCLEDSAAQGQYGRSDAGGRLTEPGEPGRYLDRATGKLRGLQDWADDLDGYRDGEYGPSGYGYEIVEPRVMDQAFTSTLSVCSYKERARLVSWVNGDWG